MRRASRLAIVLASLLVGSTCARHIVDGKLNPTEEAARRRGPDLFNAVHNVMRQWGSSIHHNGMSFFLATVAEGVLLHHGSSQPEPPVGPDWLAFEIEHAEMFARSRFFGRPPGPPPHADNAMRDISLQPMSRLQGSNGAQRMFGQGPLPPPPADKGGWLQVYRTTQPLKLLYVDGMSAGKTNMGTLDTQDRILRGLAPDTAGFGERLGGPGSERQRADDLCELCKGWGLQGVIRMEAGFEIIKCNFSESMERLQVVHRPNSGGVPSPTFGDLEYIRGVAERYEGIGSSRALIDTSSMVSAFYFPVNLSNPDPSRQDLPRLANVTNAELFSIKDYLSTVLEERSHEGVKGIDWQGISDLIVSRYADRLRYMTERLKSVHEMVREISFLIRLFIDDLEEDQGLVKAKDRCTKFYLPTASASKTDQLLQIAFTSVTTSICTTLFKVYELTSAEEPSLDAMKEELQILMEYLRWARFRRCEGCTVAQVCLIPMWPMGTVQDYYEPRCKNKTDFAEGDSYWGRSPRPPPGAAVGKDPTE